MTTTFSVTQFRQYFPATQDETIFLDSAATALKPSCIIAATVDYYQHINASVQRGQHPTVQTTTCTYEQTRRKVAKLINANQAEEIIWTKSSTESINFITQGYFRSRLQPNDEIIVSEIEHHANLIPWLIVAEQTGAKLVKWPLQETKQLSIEHLSTLITAKTRVIAISQMSNVTGEQLDIQAITTLAHQHNIVVVVDGAQDIVHRGIDLQALDIDFYVFSAHKLYGPTGLGICYGKIALLEGIASWQCGGKMLTKAYFSHFIPETIPHRFEAGTPNIAGVLAFNAVLDWMKTINWPEAENYAIALTNYTKNQLAKLPGFTSYRHSNAALLAFNYDDIHHSDLATLLAEQNIALRSGQHCAQPLMNALGIKGCLRASFMPYNSQDDADKFISAVNFALSLLREN